MLVCVVLVGGVGNIVTILLAHSRLAGNKSLLFEDYTVDYLILNVKDT